jgi:predicted nuclease of predicted toxin-antitoxin system
MRILLDENMAEVIAPVIRTVGHTVTHVRRTRSLKGKSDVELVKVAKRYDVFITMDLHRQDTEWLAVYEALVEGSIAIVRVRLPKKFTNEELEEIRTLTRRMEDWLAELEQGAALVILSDRGATIRPRTREQIRAMIDKRKRGR